MKTKWILIIILIIVLALAAWYYMNGMSFGIGGY